MRVYSIILGLLALTTPAWACTYVVPTYTVSRSFSMKVASYSPGGIKVELSSPTYKATKLTTEDGSLSFSDVPVGKYQIATAQRGQGLNDFAELDVVDSPKRSERVVLRFPVNEIVRVNGPAGRLLYRSEGEVLHVVIVKQPEGKIMGEATTDEEGFFTLAGITDLSIYSLEISDSKHEMLGAVPIVFSRFHGMPLALSLSLTTCGLMYAGDCSAGQVLKAPNACFSAVDSMGAIIADTRIRLTSIADPNQQFAMTTDRTGETRLAEILTGEYRARFDAPGFPPAERHVNFVGKACTKVVKVELGLSGCTGKMSLEKVHAQTH